MQLVCISKWSFRKPYFHLGAFIPSVWGNTFLIVYHIDIKHDTKCYNFFFNHLVWFKITVTMKSLFSLFWSILMLFISWAFRLFYHLHCLWRVSSNCTGKMGLLAASSWSFFLGEGTSLFLKGVFPGYGPPSAQVLLSVLVDD